MISIPNIISISRLLAVPLIIWLIVSNYLGAAFWVFVFAGLSDAVDGFVARRLNATSALGEIIDPVADKVLMVSIYVALGLQGLLPPWLVIVVVTRDVLIVAVFLVSSALEQKVETSPLRISKLNTAAQITLAALVLGEFGLGIGTHALVTWMGYLVAATTVLSGFGYLIRWMRGTTSTAAPSEPRSE